MKNNRVTVTQFWVSMIICSFSALLFTSNVSSVYSILLTALSLAVNLLVYFFCKDTPLVVSKVLLAVYFTYIMLICVFKFSEYMNKALGYGPVWLIVTILFVFLYFCASKGIEPVFRAGGIIVFFLFAALIYILVCCNSSVSYSLNAQFDINIYFPLINLFPSACYIWFQNNIIPSKNYTQWIYSAIVLGATSYFLCLSNGESGLFPFQRIPEIAHIDVFRGADCMLLEIFTVSVLLTASIVTTAFFDSEKPRLIHRIVFLSCICAAVLLCLYSESLSGFIFNNISALFVILLLVTAVIAETVKSLMHKNS